MSPATIIARATPVRGRRREPAKTALDAKRHLVDDGRKGTILVTKSTIGRKTSNALMR
jgi:hypothetical protein